jgi:hypothetical protein
MCGSNKVIEFDLYYQCKICGYKTKKKHVGGYIEAQKQAESSRTSERKTSRLDKGST